MEPSCRRFDLPDGDPFYTLPLLWIGLYIAGVSLFASAFMLYDFFCSISRRRLWIAPNILALNATTVFILSIATKLPSDITTAMPGLFDQLARLSGIVLLCVVQNHIMPYVGIMSGREIVSNVIALGLLVVTTVTNIWMQVGIGIATGLKFYNLYFSITMMIMFLVFVSYSLGVVPARKLLEKRYYSRHVRILMETKRSMVGTELGREMVTIEALKVCIDKYWLLGLTSSPDYIFRSSSMSTLNLMICYSTVGFAFIPALINVMMRMRDHRWCRLSSAYRWSTLAVFIIQSVAIILGTIGSLLRSLNTTTTRSFSTWDSLFKVEQQWIQLLLGWKKAPARHLENRGRNLRKLVRYTKSLVLDFFLMLQTVTIFCGKLATLIHIWVWHLTVGVLKWLVFEQGASKSCKSVMQDGHLSDYILHLEEDEDDNPFASEVVQAWRDFPQWWIAMGRRHKPAHLLHFLRSHQSEFRQQQVDSFCGFAFSEEEESCGYWTLALATIVVIIRAIDGNGESPATPLMRAVHESFRYAKFLETNLGWNLSEMAVETAEMVWDEIDLDGKWLKVDLNARNVPWRKSLELLREAATKELPDLRNQNPEEWSTRGLAAEFMIKITDQMQSDVESTNNNEVSDEAKHMLLTWLETHTAYILADCLRTLPQALLARCWNSEFGKKEEGVKEASLVLGEVEEIIQFLQLNRSI